MTISPLTIGLFWLAVILGITAGFVVLARKLAQRQTVKSEDANELLAQFRGLHSRGSLSDKEFARIRSKLGPQIKREATEATQASTMAEAAAAMRRATEESAGEWNDSSEDQTDNTDREDQQGTSDAADHAARGDCDTTPPNGGDSTQNDR